MEHFNLALTTDLYSNLIYEDRVALVGFCLIALPSLTAAFHIGAVPTLPLSGVVLRLNAPFAKREAGASEFLRGQSVGHAVTGLIGTIFLEQTNSAYAEFVWIPLYLGCAILLQSPTFARPVTGR